MTTNLCAKEFSAPFSSFSRGRERLCSILGTSDNGMSRVGEILTVCGWSQTVRKHKIGCFICLSDGSTSEALQVVVSPDMPGYDALQLCGVGCSFRITGEIIQSISKNHIIEMSCRNAEIHKVTVIGMADPAKYPLAKKMHTKEYLREIGHLRPRTKLIGAVCRVRSNMAMATHRFFQDRGFLYIHTPIITASDCEGAGEMFQVTTILPDQNSSVANQLPLTKDQKVDYTKDFFSKPAFLTVSGQLAVENYCCALSDVYTFGPTFRAENSKTSRHLAEFWMIEPELAFADLVDDMNCGEAYLKYCVEWAIVNCRKDLEYLENEEPGLIERLENIVKEPFERITYTDAIDLLKPHSDKFELKVEWGIDLATEHERYLTEEIYRRPVIVYNYPKALKAFYMRVNDDGKTVAAMDILLPKIGEIIGGSQREERLEYLDKQIEEKNLDKSVYWWYRELRQYGSVPHCGFGLGFERLIMLVTGVDNIRDVIPYPRYPGHAEF